MNVTETINGIIGKYLEQRGYLIVELQNNKYSLRDMINSVNFIRLLVDIEDAFSISIPEESFSYECLSSPKKIEQVVRECLKKC